ncbi:hypothetical protein AB6A40_008191 [Gnathostoma spinigerum]|uniref:Succinate dehydrogenase subunit 3 n=1 Tax=Gnathostoma spinigerum TaxID=75299 RepID=A0ABD6EXR7_9BILA
MPYAPRTVDLVYRRNFPWIIKHRFSTFLMYSRIAIALIIYHQTHSEFIVKRYTDFSLPKRVTDFIFEISPLNGHRCSYPLCFVRFCVSLLFGLSHFFFLLFFS